MKVSGKVKFFSPTRRFGFIVPDEQPGPEVFFHQDALTGDAIGAKITEGYSVKYVSGKDRLDRPKAFDVEVLD